MESITVVVVVVVVVVVIFVLFIVNVSLFDWYCCTENCLLEGMFMEVQ